MKNIPWFSFLASLIGFIFTGLVYTLASFAYIQNTFATKVEVTSVEARTERVESRLKDDINAINQKLDKILLKLAK